MARALGQLDHVLILREPPAHHSTILVQVPVNTWQAYNAWGGRSLYDFDYAGPRANHVSFDRPYAWKPGGQSPLGWELPIVRFLEREGYDVSYQTDVDTDRDPGSLLRHRLVIVAATTSTGRSTMRDAFEMRAHRGTNLAFMGANIAYWQVRYEDGAPDDRRVQVVLRPDRLLGVACLLLQNGMARSED